MITTQNTYGDSLVLTANKYGVSFSVHLSCIREKGLCLFSIRDLRLGHWPWLIWICRAWFAGTHSWTLVPGFFWENCSSFISLKDVSCYHITLPGIILDSSGPIFRLFSCLGLESDQTPAAHRGLRKQPPSQSSVLMNSGLLVFPTAKPEFEVS